MITYRQDAEVDYSENPRENYGIRQVENSDYSKESFKKRGNEWRDLFVHDTLGKNGFQVYTQGCSDMPAYKRATL